MTLARIITHSDLCARELAFHLLGRGYAVEIVSPDSIPDNFADLELRVDADSGDQLVASLAAYEGQRVSVLDFVHRVKTPTDEIVLGPPVVGNAPRVLGGPVVITLPPTIDDTEASTDSPNWISESSLRAEDALLADPYPYPEICPELRSEEAAHLPETEQTFPLSTSDTPELASLPANLELSEASPSERAVEPLSYFARQTSSIALPFAGPAVVLPTWEQQTLDSPIEWKSIAPAALTLTAVIICSLFLAFGVRASGKPSVGSSASARNTPSAPNASSRVFEKVTTIAKPAATTHVASPPNISSRPAADVIAPDTVTYLDRRYKPASKPNPRHARASSTRRPRGGYVAADTTTYLNRATPPQSAK